MRLWHLSSTTLGSIFFLVLVLGLGVRGQSCPPGQITHIDGARVLCCLPVDCEPNEYLKYCQKNGTNDYCAHCPEGYGLYKRTSSFAVEPCHELHVKSLGDQKCTLVNDHGDTEAAALEDMRNCFCDLEKGEYYKPPEIVIGESSNCQYVVMDKCPHGYQPSHSGKCELCPPNTVQDADGIFRLCRPQRNCTALHLETKIAGDTTRVAECANPPPLTPVPTPSPQKPDRSSAMSSTPSTTSSNTPTVRHVHGSQSDAPVIVVVVVVSCVLFFCLLLLVYLSYRKGWFKRILKGGCRHREMERQMGGDGEMQMAGEDNDNTSDNSSYTCTDSCLTSSSKNNNSSSNAAAAAKLAQAAPATDPAKANRPLPMLEAYMNMNGKCPTPQSLSTNPSLSMNNGSLNEHLYNSITHDQRMLRAAGGTDLPSYKNTNGVPPPPPRADGQDLKTPYRVQLPSSDEDDSIKNPGYAQVQPRAARNRRELLEESCETDPLLPGSENGSSGVPTPISTPTLRGILRNGNNNNSNNNINRQVEPLPAARLRGGGGGVTGGDGAGGGEVGAGNRPHLSVLLDMTEDTSHLVEEEEEGQGANLPHLSQLVSGQSTAGQFRPAAVQHQQLQRQQAPHQPHPHPQPQPEVPVHRAQQGSPAAARLLPMSAPQPLDPSLVQMEELKPVPLSPGPGFDPALPSPTSPTGVPPPPPLADKGRSSSPARINPTQQEFRASTKPKTAACRPEGFPTEKGKKVVEGETRVVREVSEETLRKQADMGASPCEDTMQKSVCRSSGLGDSLEFSSPLELPPEDDCRSRAYHRSNSEASRSVSPVHQMPARSISTPEEKHRPFAVVKPMQSDPSLNAISGSQDCLAELTQPLDAAGRHFPLASLAGRPPRRQSSQTSSDEGEQTRPKTPDNLYEEVEEEEEEEEEQEVGECAEGEGQCENVRTSASFFGENDDHQGNGQGKGSHRSRQK